MGLFDFLFNKNNISNESVKNQVLTNAEIEKLRAIKSSDERLQVIKKTPFVLPYVLNSWSKDRNIDKIVKTAINLMPENVLKLGKGNVIPTEEYVNLALETKPSVIFEMNDELKNMITIESFVTAFASDPEICASDASVLKKYINRTFKVEQKGKIKKVHYRSSVRSECLKAIRIAMGVSKVHRGYDDFANQIAQQLKANKVLQQYKTKDKMATKLATVVNALIKNQDVRLYAMPVEVWKLNNYKTIYHAVRRSCKENSKISGLLEFIPFDLLPQKVTKKVVATAIARKPEIWEELECYQLEDLKLDPYIQYVTYAACKKQNKMDIIDFELTEKEKKVAESKLKGVLKRKENKVKKAQSACLQNVVYKASKSTESNVVAKDEDLSM